MKPKYLKVVRTDFLSLKFHQVLQNGLVTIDFSDVLAKSRNYFNQLFIFRLNLYEDFDLLILFFGRIFVTVNDKKFVIKNENC